mgnify:CR=1 FL=1
MYVCTSEIVRKANFIVSQCCTRDPHRITKELGIEVLYYPFNRQRGAYKVIMRNRFMFIKKRFASGDGEHSSLARTWTRLFA